MTIFELVKIALDELYTEGKEIYGDSLDDIIIEAMQYLSRSYGELNQEERNAVDYSDPATRFAYVYKYVAAHGDYIVQVMNKLTVELDGPIFQSENVRATCVGGGPGSDIIAILKYLGDHEESEPVKKVTCYLLDGEQAWADTWTELDDSLDSDISLNANFQPLDVTAPKSWNAQKKFLQADLFTLSYFVSEVMSLDADGTVSDFWATLFNGAKPGAIFLYIDNGHDDFNTYFDEAWNASGLECLLTRNNVRFTPSFSEQASELKFYKDKFNYSPKLQARLSYRVLRKPL